MVNNQEDKIQDLRKKLADGRKQQSIDESTHSTSEDTSRYEFSRESETGSFGQSDERQDSRSIGTEQAVIGTEGQPGNRTRGITSFDLRKRQPDRRLSSSDSTYKPDGTDIQTSIGTGKSREEINARSEGNLITYDPIPERTFSGDDNNASTQETPKKRARGRPRKTSILSSFKSPETFLSTPQPEQEEKTKRTFKASNTLSQQEAKNLLEPLAQALQDDFSYIDMALWELNKDQSQQPIWSDADNDECMLLAELLIKRGQKSPMIASAIRTTVDAKDYLQAGMIILPRFKRTVNILQAANREHRNKPDRKEILQKQKEARLNAIRY